MTFKSYLRNSSEFFLNTSTFSDAEPIKYEDQSNLAKLADDSNKILFKSKIEEKIKDFNDLPSKLTEIESCEALGKSTFLQRSLVCETDLALKIAAKTLKKENSHGFTHICKHEATLSATIKNGSVYLHNSAIFGKGNFKKALKSTCINSNGTTEEIIRLKVSKDFNKNNNIDDAEAEIKLQMSLDHPHIVKVKDYNRYQNLKNEEQLEIFEEACETTLDKAQLNPKEILQVMVDLSSALEYLHEKGLVHNDLKSDNILIKNKRGKLADFGLCKKVGVQPFTRCEEILPPEFRTAISGPSTPAGDVYQFGLMLKSRFGQEKGGMQELIATCLQEDPLKRPTIAVVHQELKTKLRL